VRDSLLATAHKGLRAPPTYDPAAPPTPTSNTHRNTHKHTHTRHINTFLTEKCRSDVTPMTYGTNEFRVETLFHMAQHPPLKSKRKKVIRFHVIYIIIHYLQYIINKVFYIINNKYTSTWFY